MKSTSHRFRALLAALVGMPLLVLSCSSGGGGSATPGSKTLIYADQLFTGSFDPGHQDGNFEYLDSVYDGLVRVKIIDPQGDVKIFPDLATSWDVNSDNTVYTFHLRHDAYFTDVVNGQIQSHANKVTSADVKFSLDRLWNLQTNLAGVMNGYSEIDTPDPYTVVIKMAHPDVAVVLKMSSAQSGIYDSKVAKEHGGVSDQTAITADTLQAWMDQGNSIGSGPFYIYSFVTDDTVVVKRNPYYWGPTPALDTVIDKNVPDPATMRQLLESGAIDIAYGLNMQTAKAMESDPNIVIKYQHGATAYTELFLNNRPEFTHYSNKLVRQAIFWALDYNGILALDNGHARNMPTVIPQGIFACCGIQGYHQDLNKAKALLAQAGYPNGFSDTISYQTEQDEWGDEGLLAQKVSNDLAKIGLTITLAPYGDNYSDIKRAGKIGFGIDGWGGINDPDQFFADQYVSSYNYLTTRLGLHDPRIDQLYPQSLAVSGDARLQIYNQLQTFALDDSTVIGILQPDAVLAYRSNVHGYDFVPQEYHTYLDPISKS